MKIMIGSCGGLTGSYLARQFKQKGLTVCGCDINKINATTPFLDEQYLICSSESENFVSEIIELLNNHNIDYYVPTHSKEICKVAEYERQIANEWKGKFTVSPYETFQKLDNKEKANYYLDINGVPVPKVIKSIQQANKYPIFMKPNVGSGGRNSILIETPNIHREYRNKYPDASFYEYISGKEYTVDCFYDGDGNLVSYNQRIRLKSMGGAVIISKNDYSFDIEPYLKILSDSFIFKGCVNFQYILRDSVPYFIDINLRYASGGLPLSVKSGVDVPQYLLDVWNGNQINNVKSCAFPGLTMYRYYEEWFSEE